MRLGISLASRHAVHDPREGARIMLDRSRAARDAGLDSLTVGDHHVNSGPYYQNTPMLGRLLAEWAPDRPAGCLFLLPLWNPVLVAEQVGTLASIHPGPFIVQTGIGHGEPAFAGMGAEHGTRGRVTAEAIEVVGALLRGEHVTHDRFGIVDAQVSPTPPEPVTWWVGGGAPVALERAARLGDAWYAGPGVTTELAPTMLVTYRAACAEHGRTPSAIVRKDVIVLADDARAVALGDEMIGAGYRGMPRHAVVAGGPARVAEELQPFAELGFDEVVVRNMSGDPDIGQETIEQLAEVRRLLA